MDNGDFQAEDSEIHDCSITIARLLTKQRILNKNLVTDISQQIKAATKNFVKNLQHKPNKLENTLFTR